MDDDDVIDYMVMEAVALKAAKEDKDQEKQKKAEDWKKDRQGLDALREAAG